MLSDPVFFFSQPHEHRYVHVTLWGTTPELWSTYAWEVLLWEGLIYSGDSSPFFLLAMF